VCSSDLGDDWTDDNSQQNWRTGVEYVMTPEGIKRTDNAIEKNREWDADEEAQPLQDYRKSRRDLERELEKKNRELEEIKKELDKPAQPKKTALNTPPSAKAGLFSWLQSAKIRPSAISENKITAAAYIFYHKLI
jgi:hypothetical protein